MATFEYYNQAYKVTDKTSNLLELIRGRESGVDSGMFGPQTEAQIERDRQGGRLILAVRQHALANPSDPFAAARIANALERGLIAADEVSKTALSMLAGRGGH